jgi:precorrin-2 dehydrogenase / sirohydrochlorin ferrochelatase
MLTKQIIFRNIDSDTIGHMAFLYPVFLDLADIPVLVVGGGPVAWRKAEGLAAAGARVTVVAPHIVPELAALAAVVVQREYRSDDIRDHRLVITATSDGGVNAQVAADATAEGVWVNSADDPANCSFILPAIARRGPLIAALSTGGASPALAGRLRDAIADDVLTPQAEAAAIELARQRAEVHAAGGSTELVDWTDRVTAALRGDAD